MKMGYQDQYEVTDTCTIKHFSYKTPQYGAHKARVITKRVAALEKKGWIEDDHGPWGIHHVVLAAKPNQEHVAWWEFVFQLCVSYQRLNGFR
jgi:hypothetical protein